MRYSYLFSFAIFVCFSRHGRADTFGSGANSFEIEFVAIASLGNPGDFPLVLGDVAYRYRIGKYEISEQMIDKANALRGLGITKDTRGPDKPATSITWFEAARFVNWLNTSSGFPRAYKFDGFGNFELWQPADPGYNPNNLYRSKLARYVLPSADEWYKAAYYDPTAGAYYDYPTGSNTAPDGIDFVGDPFFDAVFHDGAFNSQPNDIMNVGLQSPYGTAGQGGNVDEWQESSVDLTNDTALKGRGFRGGSWGARVTTLAASNANGIVPSFPGEFLGFRVAYIPEPNPTILLRLGLIGIVGLTRCNRKYC